MILSEPTTLAAALVVVILIGSSKGGFAGVGALATPLLVLVMPPTTALGLLLPILVAQDVVSVWSFRRHWDGWILAWMVPGSVVGILAGWALAAQVNDQMLMVALGLISAGFGLYRLVAERGGRILAPSTSPGWVGAISGAFSGFTSQLAHAGGPPFQMWVMPRKSPHLVFVGTAVIFFAIVNLLKIGTFIALGVFTRDVLLSALLLLPVATISTLCGVWLIRRLDGARFYTITYVLMVVLGAKLVWDGLG